MILDTNFCHYCKKELLSLLPLVPIEGKREIWAMGAKTNLYIKCNQNRRQWALGNLVIWCEIVGTASGHSLTISPFLSKHFSSKCLPHTIAVLDGFTVVLLQFVTQLLNRPTSFGGLGNLEINGYKFICTHEMVKQQNFNRVKYGSMCCCLAFDRSLSDLD